MYHCIELDIAIDRTIPFHINSGSRYKFIGRVRNGICLMQYDIFKTILPKRQLYVTENIDMIMQGFLECLLSGEVNFVLHTPKWAQMAYSDTYTFKNVLH